MPWGKFLGATNRTERKFDLKRFKKVNWGDTVLAGYSFLVGERTGWTVIRMMRKENPGGSSLQESFRFGGQVYVEELEGGAGIILHE